MQRGQRQQDRQQRVQRNDQQQQPAGSSRATTGGDQQQHRDQQQHHNSDQTKRERPKKESIIDLSKFIDKQVRVKFQGGREASGRLKGYDQLLNLVLTNATEYLKDSEDSYKISDNTRKLGLVVCRGPAVTVVCPQDGHEAIQNPFVLSD